MPFEETPLGSLGHPLALLGREVRRGRHALGYTQREFGVLVKMSQSAVSRLEHGRCPGLPIERFVRLMLILGWLGSPEERTAALRFPHWFRTSADLLESHRELDLDPKGWLDPGRG
ncbi:MAG TPA: helix-turn-helix transcriptional regulator [Candidatus Limnocylindrales bacterium]|nr:helix-turn-helix transcriptional regulator [Candidatus Limnocylindrales bacterium]